MKSWLEKNDLETYSMHNEGKSAIAERFIRALKNKVYKYITSISENVYIDKLDYIVNKYNNAYHSTIKIKPVKVKSNTYIDSSKEINDKILNLKFVILLEYQNVKTFLQKSVSNWFEKMFQIGLKRFLRLKKLKTLCRGDMLLVILKAKNLLERFTKKNCKKQIKKSLELKK